jgi:hypothetical protein
MRTSVVPFALSLGTTENPPQGSGPRYQPVMIMRVESGGRKAGRIVETHALGCTFYFYNARGTP